MKIKINHILLSICIVFGALIYLKSSALAYNIVPPPSGYTYKTLYTTPVYTVPDINQTPVLSIDRDIKINVLGITDTGYYQVDLGAIYYIPGAFLNIDTHTYYGTEALKEFYKKIADAYNMQLESSQSTISSFIIKDITGDSIPELISSNGREIYTYYNERPVMIYCSDFGATFYYNKSTNLVISSYVYNSKTQYEIYSMNYSLLPWGQLYCIYPNLMGQKLEDYKKLDKYYTNSDEVRQKLGETLYSLYVAGSL